MAGHSAHKNTVFFHPDCTVGSGITPDRPHNAVSGLYRRWGIAPRPKDNLHYTTDIIFCKEFFVNFENNKRQTQLLLNLSEFIAFLKYD